MVYVPRGPKESDMTEATWHASSQVQCAKQLILSPLVVQTVKNPPATQDTQVASLGGEDPLEKGMATHSRILAWRIPWSLVGLQSMGSQRVGHD